MQIEYYNSILSKAKQEEKTEAIQLYLQQLWQMDNLMVLIGAGFSKAMNGPLISDLSRETLPEIILQGISQQVKGENNAILWKNLWEIEEGLSEKINNAPKEVNPEELPDLLDHCSRLNIEAKIGELQSILTAFRALGIDEELYRNSLSTIKTRIFERISGITRFLGDEDFTDFRNKLQPYRSFLKRLITYRRPQQPRIKIFSSNYDTVVETACDIEGIHCVTGFEGQILRCLNPNAFDVDLTFRTSGQVSVYYANVVHLYKLHGSIDWRIISVDGIDEVIQGKATGGEVLIYPCYTKFAETLESPYYEMFRRFGDATSQPQSVLLSIGYGFNDEHINQMVMRAYKNPSCQLILIEPRATQEADNLNNFVKNMLRMAMPEPENPISDPRVTIIGGRDATFPQVLNVLFPPLEIESPSDQIKKLVQRLIQLGQEQR